MRVNLRFGEKRCKVGVIFVFLVLNWRRIIRVASSFGGLILVSTTHSSIRSVLEALDFSFGCV